MKDAILALLRSRKFLLALFGVIQAVVFGLNPDFPDEVWQAIAALVTVLIGAIAIEDAALKRAGPSATLVPHEVTLEETEEE